MRSTGKKDIKGIEVKEGDKVRYISRVRYTDKLCTEKKTETGTVVWRNYSFKIDMDNPAFPDERFYSLNQKNLEVIGKEKK